MALSLMVAMVVVQTLPVFRSKALLVSLNSSKNIGAIHWGFVSDETQTIYPWRPWVSIIRFWDGLFSDEPNPWHHDLLYENGSAYSLSEVEFIRTQINSKTK